jgi:hypothetical protein
MDRQAIKEMPQDNQKKGQLQIGSTLNAQHTHPSRETKRLCRNKKKKKRDSCDKFDRQ